MLDNRMNACAEFVTGRGISVDVGTDHAHLAAELIISGKCDKVIACDINEGPLESARKTLEKYGIEDKVELILSDGLENIRMVGVTDYSYITKRSNFRREYKADTTANE